MEADNSRPAAAALPTTTSASSGLLGVQVARVADKLNIPGLFAGSNWEVLEGVFVKV